jgi:hypothetical protein
MELAAHAKTPPALGASGVFEKNLAIPTFALVGTIIGPESLTTVFGMGTGVSSTVWSPEEVPAAAKRPTLDLVAARAEAGDQAWSRLLCVRDRRRTVDRTFRALE